MVAYEAVFEGVADPTRRKILAILKDGELSVGAIASRLPVSRPAVSQHLRILADARLVVHRRDGTRNYYRLERYGFDRIKAYAEAFWDDVLQSYSASAKGANRDED